jgi:hypothetical protein
MSEASSATLTIRILRLWLLNMQNKQTPVKWQESKRLLRHTSKGGNNKNQNLCQSYAKIAICTDSETM